MIVEFCSKIDPIETVTGLCSQNNILIDEPDKFGKYEDSILFTYFPTRSPLIYASQRAATISALYLLRRGAGLERKDNWGNTPLVFLPNEILLIKIRVHPSLLGMLTTPSCSSRKKQM